MKSGDHIRKYTPLLREAKFVMARLHLTPEKFNITDLNSSKRWTEQAYSKPNYKVSQPQVRREKRTLLGSKTVGLN